MYKIQYTFEEKGMESITIENAEAGFSVLEIALKNKIDISHNCGGVCACSTCHVYIDQGDTALEELSDKEEDFIDRARNPKLTSRLSCQCVLEEGSGEIKVHVPDQSTILGE